MAAALMLGLKTLEVYDSAAEWIPRPCSFINFWLLRSGCLTPGFSWGDFKGGRLSSEDSGLMLRQTRAFLEETCKELLIIVGRRRRLDPGHSELGWDVEFFHRTVSDFLHDNHWRLILEQQ
jgi:hypothetical protein